MSDLTPNDRYQEAVDHVIDVLPLEQQTAFWQFIDGELSADEFRDAVRG